MGRPRNTPLRIALRTARKTLAKIEQVDSRIQPKWHAKMLAYWQSEVKRLRREVAKEQDLRS